jgi:hypothetical protein
MTPKTIGFDCAMHDRRADVPDDAHDVLVWV